MKKVTELTVENKSFAVIEIDTKIGRKFGTVNREDIVDGRLAKEYNGITMLIEDTIEKAIDRRVTVERSKARKPYVEELIEKMEVEVSYDSSMGILVKREDGRVIMANVGVTIDAMDYATQEKVLLTIKKKGGVL